MKVFAHRGLSSRFPENTLEAFKQAYNYNIDGIETDVQLTKDGEMVIIHDEKLDRTTNGTGFVKDHTLEELKKLNANNGYEGNYEIPTLDELLSFLKDKKGVINLELKTSIFEYKGIEQKVYDCIKKYGVEDRIIISSFNHETLVRFKKIDSSIKTGVLTADVLVNATNYVKNVVGADAFHPLFVSLTKEKVEDLHNNNLAVNVWTVDEEIYYNMLKAINVDVVMTNKCDVFCSKL